MIKKQSLLRLCGEKILKKSKENGPRELIASPKRHQIFAKRFIRYEIRAI